MVRARPMLLLVALGLGLAGPRNVLAQEAPPAQLEPLPSVVVADEGRGWLGLRVEERYGCRWDTAEEWKNCTLVTRISEMQEDGPAAHAGVLVGDRLVAIDDEEITLDNWPGLLGSVRPGISISLRMARGGDAYSVQVTPAPRPPDPSRIPMIGRSFATGREPSLGDAPEPTVRLVRLGEAAARSEEEEGRISFALTFRNTEERGLALEPLAVRQVEGRLEVRLVGDRPLPDREARRDLGASLVEAKEAAYEDFSGVLQRLDQVRARLSSDDFRRGMTALARMATEEVDLARRFHRTFAGAEFESVRGFSGQDGLDGLLVLRVVPGTIAARVGLRPGDLLIRAGETPVREVRDLFAATAAASAAAAESGERMQLSVVWIRNGREVRGVWPGRSR